MTRTNPDKLSVEYPVIKFIKRRMKRNDDIKTHQINKFDNRVKGSPFLLQIIQYTQELFESAPDDKGETAETRRLAMIIRGHLNTIENQDIVYKKQIAELKEKLEDLELELSTRRAFD